MAMRAPLKQPRLTAAEWRRAQTLVEAGESHAETARRFGCQTQTITRRAKKEGWRDPKRRETPNRVVATEENPTQSQKNTELTGEFYSLAKETAEIPAENALSLSPDLRAALEAAAKASPEGIQSAFGTVAQIMVAQGITQVPSPRNVAELKTWFDIFRKATGLDAKDKGPQAPASLVPSMRTLSRRAVEVVEVEPEPDMEDI